MNNKIMFTINEGNIEYISSYFSFFKFTMKLKRIANKFIYNIT